MGASEVCVACGRNPRAVPPDFGGTPEEWFRRTRPVARGLCQRDYARSFRRANRQRGTGIREGEPRRIGVRVKRTVRLTAEEAKFVALAVTASKRPISAWGARAMVGRAEQELQLTFNGG